MLGGGLEPPMPCEFRKQIAIMCMGPGLRGGMSRNLKKDNEEQVSEACTDFRA
jgi:hypothetical protein